MPLPAFLSGLKPDKVFHFLVGAGLFAGSFYHLTTGDTGKAAELLLQGLAYFHLSKALSAVGREVKGNAEATRVVLGDGEKG